jgi:trans-aconitate methyltransferase
MWLYQKRNDDARRRMSAVGAGAGPKLGLRFPVHDDINTASVPKHGMNYWVSRWDSMQEFYNPDRKARFETLVHVVKANTPNPLAILDLGCGTGSVMQEFSDAFPAAELMGIDFDFTLLSLAKERLAKDSSRVSFIQADLRKTDWAEGVSGRFDGVLSATALHWLSDGELATLYCRIYSILKPGGIFLNADHVACPNVFVQQHWQEQKRLMTPKTENQKEPWVAFWEDYFRELGDDSKVKRNAIQGDWHGIEEGLPLEWHFAALKKAGFASADCFYRFFGDAIYGGIKA